MKWSRAKEIANGATPRVTNREIAQALGMSECYVSQILVGERKAPDAARRVAEYLTKRAGQTVRVRDMEMSGDGE